MKSVPGAVCYFFYPRALYIVLETMSPCNIEMLWCGTMRHILLRILLGSSRVRSIPILSEEPSIFNLVQK